MSKLLLMLPNPMEEEEEQENGEKGTVGEKLDVVEINI